MAGSQHQSQLAPAANKFHVGNGDDGKHYWLTPPDLYAALNMEFHFDFDPCPHPLPTEFDGLTCEWGESNYVNPPFGSIMHEGRKKGPTAWVRKAIEEQKKGKLVVLVYPVDKWVLMILNAIGTKVRNLGDVRWLAIEDGSQGKGNGQTYRLFHSGADSMNWHETPIYIISRDRLDLGLRDLLAWLRRADMTSITIIDNASTYQPLLDFYNSPAMDGVNLIRRDDNLGHEVFWRLDYHLHQPGRFIVTDSDIVPDSDCPLDLVRRMHEVADRFPGGAKVGPAIRIDNLPDYFRQREHMRFCESDYWVRKYPEGDCWNAALDTTFAIYESGWTRWPLAERGGVPHVRLDFPYVVRHIPWYEDSANPSAESLYYRAHASPEFSSSLSAMEAADAKR